MQQKDLFGLVLFAVGIFGGVVVACASKRARDLFFVLMVWLSPITERFDINFVSRDWYRGTTRGFEFSLVDILAISVLISAVLVPRRGQSRGYWPASFGLMLLFFLFACFNVAISDPRLFGLFELSKLVRGITIFLAAAFYLRTERELRLLLFALALAMCHQGLLGIKQRYLNGQHRVLGTVDDSNSLSFLFCIVAPVLAASITARLPRLLKTFMVVAVALACVGVILTITRMGVITMGIVLLGTALATVSWRVTPRKLIVGIVILLGVTGVLAKSWKTLAGRFSGTDFQAEYGNKKLLGRGYYIRIAREIGQDRWLGVGLNNWSYWVSSQYGPRLGYKFVPYKGTDQEPSARIPEGSNVDIAQAAPAHSLAALTLGEMGYPGLLLLAMLWLRWFQMGAVFLRKRSPESMRRVGIGLFFALVAMFIHSQTEWAFRHSPVYYVVHILLGALASLYYLRRQEQSVLITEPEYDVAHVYSPAGIPAQNY